MNRRCRCRQHHCTVSLLAPEFHPGSLPSLESHDSAPHVNVLPPVSPVLPTLRFNLVLSRCPDTLRVNLSPSSWQYQHGNQILQVSPAALSSHFNSQKLFVKIHAHVDNPTQLPHDLLEFQLLLSVSPSLANWLHFQILASSDLMTDIPVHLYF